MEPVADGALADDRQLGVDVDRAGARDEEEARLEVLQVVDRQRVELLAVDRQDPGRQEPRVEREQARSARSAAPRCRRVRRRRRTCCRRGSGSSAGHRQPLRLPTVRADAFIFRPVGGGKSRWNRTRPPGRPTCRARCEGRRPWRWPCRWRDRRTASRCARSRSRLRAIARWPRHACRLASDRHPSRSRSTRACRSCEAGTVPRSTVEERRRRWPSITPWPTVKCPSLGRRGAWCARAAAWRSGTRPPHAWDVSIPRSGVVGLIYMASGVINAPLRSNCLGR